MGLDPIESLGSQEVSASIFPLKNALRRNTKESETMVSKQATSEIKPIPIEKPKKEPASKKYKNIDLSDDTVRDFVLCQLAKFDARMEFETEILNLDIDLRVPTEFELVDYMKYVVISCKMEAEIPIIALIYIEKLLFATGILLNKYNWRRLTLICLCLASKVWDDDSLENVHFPKVMPDVKLNEINKLEQAFLEFIDYRLVLTGSDYAKYYFIMRSLAEKIVKEGEEGKLSEFENEIRNKKSRKASEEWGQFPLKDVIQAGQMLKL